MLRHVAIGYVLVTAAATGATADGAFPDLRQSPDIRQSMSPWHRVQDGNGRPIPCVCSYQGRSLPLGASACLQTPSGWQIARCDFNQNVTSWVPTGLPCNTV